MIVILTSEEREAVRKVAKLAHRSMSNWMHWTILQELRKHVGLTELNTQLNTNHPTITPNPLQTYDGSDIPEFIRRAR
jgi:hypothetical protein